MGDFNIDLLKSNTHTASFLDLMLNNLMFPQIIGPTRLNEKVKFTLIDHVYYNNIVDVHSSRNLLSPVTDHLPNFFIIVTKSFDKSDHSDFRRDFSNYDVKALLNDISREELLNKVLPLDNVEEKYNTFHEMLEQLIDTHAPLTPLSNKQRKQADKPWINDHIINLIKEKHCIYKTYIKHQKLEDLKLFLIKRHKINHEIRRSKYYYFKRFFENNKNNIKKRWDAVKLICRKPITLFKNGKTINEPIEVAKIINN